MDEILAEPDEQMRLKIYVEQENQELLAKYQELDKAHEKLKEDYQWLKDFDEAQGKLYVKLQMEHDLLKKVYQAQKNRFQGKS